uniref:ubiquitin carboxyl-terminal hydrolase 37-like isoform X1 n=1 Tax=Styela clava TaxID=7725 RepID=UPI001939FF28|nr:ubiquitin carboxyl-terminal hydrolase 37-like isoform X1 [Styela clava]
MNVSDESKLQKETKKQRKASTTQKTDLTSTLSFHSSWKKKSNMIHTSGLETIQETPNLQMISKAGSTIVSSTKPIGSLITKSSNDKVDDIDVELASSVNQYGGLKITSNNTETSSIAYGGLKITSNNTETSSIASQNEAFNGGLHLLPSNCFFRCLVQLQSKRYSSVIEKRQLLGNIKNAVSKFAPQFNGSEQHDAHEFVRVALTLLKQEINDALLKEQNLGSVLHQECPITANFGFKVQHSYKCTRCSFTFAIIEDWYDIPVDIISSLEIRSIQQLLSRSIRKEEEIENSCRSCSNGRSIKTIRIVELPRILTVYLMRYNVDRTGRVRKIHQNIGISRNLSLTKYQLNPTDANNNLLLPESVTALYELTSIVNHLGETPTSGHYISDVLRDNVSRTWQCYDDNIVTNTYGDGILQRRELDAYVLFYIRT